MKPVLKPPPLRPGDTIGIVAPASAVKREAIETGVRGLERLGYGVKLGAALFDFSPQYFAGDAPQRVADLHAMFADPEVRAIVCARGGYGTNYLLPLLDLRLIARNPKPLVGHSDITSLLTLICDQTGLVTFHGPMLSKDFGSDQGVDLASWSQALSSPGDWIVTAQQSGATPLRTGTAAGRMYGGCLSLLVESLGTPYEIQTNNAILLLEDVAAKPFQIDRMLMHLKYSGRLDQVRGIVFGEMLECVQPGGMSYSLEEMVLRVLDDFPGPIAFGFRSGHVSSGNVTVPVGVEAELEVSGNVTLRFTESAVAV